jgi:hypothetical protein
MVRCNRGGAIRKTAHEVYKIEKVFTILIKLVRLESDIHLLTKLVTTAANKIALLSYPRQ